MTSLVADYGTSSGSESENDARSDDTDNISKGDDEEDEERGDNVIVDLTNGHTVKEQESSNDNDDDGVDNDDDHNGDDGVDGDDDDDDDNNKQLPLPTPNFTAAPTLKTSVFSNPFVEAEKAKSAILEKHVKMTPTLDDTKMINGRKICWNYRKGRCRFGHNCTFAHDSDLHRSAAELEALRTPEETLICQTHYSSQMASFTNDDEQEIDQENNQLFKRKKRPGLAQNLVPGKKVLKLYKAQQAKALSR